MENQVLIDMKTLTALQENSAVGKKAYDSKAAGIKHLQAELDALLAEKERLEGCIVPSPQEIQHLYDIEKQKAIYIFLIYVGFIRAKNYGFIVLYYFSFI